MKKKYIIPDFVDSKYLESRFFSILSVEEKEFYRPYFASLRRSTRLWLAFHLYLYIKYDILPKHENRNAFVQELFEKFVQKESEKKEESEWLLFN